jgi:hypothetical protein
MNPCDGRLIITPDDMRRAIGDEAKWCYAHGTRALAELQYRIAELATRGTISHDDGIDLQSRLYDVWLWLYGGTLCATRNYELDDEDWDHDDLTYSDGRPVRVRTRVQPLEDDYADPANTNVLETAAVAECPRGEIEVIQLKPGEPNPRRMGAE